MPGEIQAGMPLQQLLRLRIAAGLIAYDHSDTSHALQSAVFAPFRHHEDPVIPYTRGSVGSASVPELSDSPEPVDDDGSISSTEAISEWGLESLVNDPLHAPKSSREKDTKANTKQPRNPRRSSHKSALDATNHSHPRALSSSSAPLLSNHPRRPSLVLHFADEKNDEDSAVTSPTRRAVSFSLDSPTFFAPPRPSFLDDPATSKPRSSLHERSQSHHSSLTASTTSVLNRGRPSVLGTDSPPSRRSFSTTPLRPFPSLEVNAPSNLKNMSNRKSRIDDETAIADDDNALDPLDLARTLSFDSSVEFSQPTRISTSFAETVPEVSETQPDIDTNAQRDSYDDDSDRMLRRKCGTTDFDSLLQKHPMSPSASALTSNVSRLSSSAADFQVSLDQDPRMTGWTPEARLEWLQTEQEFPMPRFSSAARPNALVMPSPLVYDKIEKDIKEGEEKRAQEEEKIRNNKPVREPGKLYGKSLMDDLETRKQFQKNRKRVFTGDRRRAMHQPFIETMNDTDAPVNDREPFQRYSTAFNLLSQEQKDQLKEPSELKFEQQQQAGFTGNEKNPGGFTSVYGFDPVLQKEMEKLEEILKLERAEKAIEDAKFEEKQREEEAKALKKAEKLERERIQALSKNRESRMLQDDKTKMKDKKTGNDKSKKLKRKSKHISRVSQLQRPPIALDGDNEMNWISDDSFDYDDFEQNEEQWPPPLPIYREDKRKSNLPSGYDSEVDDDHEDVPRRIRASLAAPPPKIDMKLDFEEKETAGDEEETEGRQRQESLELDRRRRFGRPRRTWFGGSDDEEEDAEDSSDNASTSDIIEAASDHEQDKLSSKSGTEDEPLAAIVKRKSEMALNEISHRESFASSNAHPFATKEPHPFDNDKLHPLASNELRPLNPSLTSKKSTATSLNNIDTGSPLMGDVSLGLNDTKGYESSDEDDNPRLMSRLQLDSIQDNPNSMDRNERDKSPKSSKSGQARDDEDSSDSDDDNDDDNNNAYTIAQAKLKETAELDDNMPLAKRMTMMNLGKNNEDEDVPLAKRMTQVALEKIEDDMHLGIKGGNPQEQRNGRNGDDVDDENVPLAALQNQNQAFQMALQQQKDHMFMLSMQQDAAIFSQGLWGNHVQPPYMNTMMPPYMQPGMDPGLTMVMKQQQQQHLQQPQNFMPEVAPPNGAVNAEMHDSSVIKNGDVVNAPPGVDPSMMGGIQGYVPPAASNDKLVSSIDKWRRGVAEEQES